jgi:hypothetical protein
LAIFYYKDSPSPVKYKNEARHWWLTPVILVTQEAEIRRIEFQSQPGQKVHD